MLKTCLASSEVKNGKIPVGTCQDCSSQLILPKLPSPYDELSVYDFLQNKTYQEVGCLVYSTPAMTTFVGRLETLFSGISEGIIHMLHVLARLCKCADDFCTFLKCKEVKCSSVIEKYGKVLHESMNISCFDKIQCTNKSRENGKT